MVEPCSEPVESFVACSKCFSDQGLHLDAFKRGTKDSSACPNCGSNDGRKLTEKILHSIALDYFVRGSMHRSDYGGASVIYANDSKPTDITFPPSLKNDVPIIERITKLGLFRSAPRVWRLGHISPLQQLEAAETRQSVISRILDEYPAILVYPQEFTYRIRKTPNEPEQHHEYDSRPRGISEDHGRFDSDEFPVMYASPDLQLCIHECRVTAEDELYVATLDPTRLM